MSEYTTIRISKKTKNNLDKLKGNRSIKYDAIIGELLKRNGGLVANDVIKLEREPVALTLRYITPKTEDFLEITYRDLRDSNVGDWFKIEPQANDSECFFNEALVVYHSDDVVALMVRTVETDQNNTNTDIEFIDIRLF